MRKLEKIKWSNEITNEEGFNRINKRTLLIISCVETSIKVGHIEGQMAELKGVGRGRRTQFLGDLGNRRKYWEREEEAEI